MRSRRTPTLDQAAEALRKISRILTEAVVQGRYAPGEFLPTEQELAKEYGSSRNVIRESLKLLMARGLIEMLHGRGSRVLPHHHWQLRDQLVRLMRENPRVAHDILLVRRILEPEIAFLAAQHATDEQIEAMRVAVASLQSASDQAEAAIEHDAQFHRLLAEATDNTLLPLVLQPVDRLIYASRVATVNIPGALEQSIRAHQAILERVAAHDADGARDAMREHLSQVETEIPKIAGSTE